MQITTEIIVFGFRVAQRKLWEYETAGLITGEPHALWWYKQVCHWSCFGRRIKKKTHISKSNDATLLCGTMLKLNRRHELLLFKSISLTEHTDFFKLKESAYISNKSSVQCSWYLVRVRDVQLTQIFSYCTAGIDVILRDKMSLGLCDLKK